MGEFCRKTLGWHLDETFESRQRKIGNQRMKGRKWNKARNFKKRVVWSAHTVKPVWYMTLWGWYGRWLHPCGHYHMWQTMGQTQNATSGNEKPTSWLDFLIITESVPSPTATKTTANPWCSCILPSYATGSSTASQFGNLVFGHHKTDSYCKVPTPTHDTTCDMTHRPFLMWL